MSVILMTSHDENIYNITKTQDLKKMMAPAYKSKFRDKHRQIKQYKECVKLHATMGVPEEEPPDPSRFLKKHTGEAMFIHSAWRFLFFEGWESSYKGEKPNTLQAT
nr:unnamed protein product [Callosobruchus chinensis]